MRSVRLGIVLLLLITTRVVAWDPCPEGFDADCAILESPSRAQCLLGHHDVAGLEDWQRASPENPWPYFALGASRWEALEAIPEFQAAAARFMDQADLGMAIRSHVAVAMTHAREGRCDAIEPSIRAIESLVANGDALHGDALYRDQARLGLARVRALCGIRLDAQRKVLIEVADAMRASTLDPRAAEVYRLRREALRALRYVARYLGRTQEARDAALDNIGWAQERGCARDALAFEFDELLVRLDRPTVVEDASALVAGLVAELESVRDRVDAAGATELGARMRLLLDEVRPRVDARSAAGQRALEALDACRVGARTLNIDDLERQCLLAQAALHAESSPAEARRLLAEAADFDHLSRWGRLRGWERRAQALEILEGPAAADRSIEAVLDGVDDLWRQQVDTMQERILHSFAPAYYVRSGRALEGYVQSRDRAGLALGFAIIERLRANELHHLPTGALASGDRAQLHPGTADPLGTTTPPSVDLLDTLQAALGGDRALLSFQLAPDRRLDGTSAGGAWLIAITAEDETAIRLPDGHVLAQQVADLLDGDGDVWASLESPAQARRLGALHDDLVADGLDWLPIGIDEVIIVADAALDRLPWAALAASPGHPHLGTRFALTHAPSASFWLHRQRQTPTLTSPSPLVITAPEIARGARFPGRQGVRNYGPLPFSRREGAAVLRRLGPSSVQNRPERAAHALADDAALAQSNLVYVASHAVSDELNIEDAAILVGRRDDGGPVWLDFLALSRLDLDGKVVVLSTCESHAGEVLRGTGVMSLAHAAFLAGAEAVVATRARLPDRDGARFFDQWVSRLAAGESLAEALHATRTDWIASGAPSAVWAQVVLLGNGDVVLAPGGIQRGAFAGLLDVGLHLWDFQRGRLVSGAGLLLLAGLGVHALRRRQEA